LPEKDLSFAQMTKFLIVNGDDFGRSRGVNRAIIEAHEGGILTSASLMVTGAACEEAIAIAKSHPHLAVGLHLVLVCGKSVLPPRQIPHLVDASGSFPDDPVQAGLCYQFNKAAKQELQREIRAQLERFRQTGLPLSHVDGHLHLHVHPVVLRILVELAQEFDIQFIRLPYEELSFTLKCDHRGFWSKVIGSLVFSQLRHYGENLLRANGIGFAQRVYGLLQTGKITEDYLVGLIPQIRAKIVEIYAHPSLMLEEESQDSVPESGLIELEALLSQEVRDTLTLSGFELTNYPALGAIAAA
jgi:hopanoid biosynthesis associated protein HpnK